MRFRDAWLLSALVTLVAVAGAVVVGGSVRHTPQPVAAVGVRDDVSPGSPPTRIRAVSVFDSWDRRRAHAWGHQDARALAALYSPTSPAGRRDVDHLRRWAARGLRVTGLRHQVASFYVRRRTPALLVAVATTRLLAPVAHAGRRSVSLPVGGWHAQVVTWRRTRAGWVVTRTRGVPQPAR
jgi:hypothetical protein